MSSKSRFRPNGRPKFQVQLPATPRQIKEIEEAYGQSVMRAGQVQYQLYILEQELETLNQELMTLNKEAAQRNELDKKASEAAKAQEAQNV